MIVDVEEVGYGRPASQALARAIAAAKAGAALAPVTVIVPSNFAGLSARRLLGSKALADSGIANGIANVSFLTPFRLAELLAADQLLDSRPLTNPVLGAAVRLALAAEPGPFAPVAEHQATEAALAALYAELSNIGIEPRQRVAEHGPTARAAVRLFQAIAARLGAFHDESTVAFTAAERPRLAMALEPFGSFVWFLPAALHPPLAHLLSIVFAIAPTTVLIGLTADADADAAVRTACRRVGVSAAQEVRSHPSSRRVPTADRIVSVTDADEEVRAVLREVVAQCEQGVALDRMGIFYPTAEPYLAILEQQLSAASLPANGPSRLRLAETAAGRTLLAALSLPSQQWRRDRVLALVSGAPVRQQDGPARPATWERLSRQAGVVAGLADWQVKLAAYAAAGRKQAAARPELDVVGRARLERDAADSEELARFVEQLAVAVRRVHDAEGWASRSEAAAALLRQLLGHGNQRRFWPEAEQAAAERVEDALVRLAALDELEANPSMTTFQRALSAELDVSRDRNGRFGHGVWYGPLVAAVGHDLDAVFVLGCAEGLCPSPRREDALLSDGARQLARGDLELRESRLHDQHRAFLAALAAAPAGQRTLLFPRGDLRGGRRALPSRWLLDSASQRAGRPVVATEFDALGEQIVSSVPSFATGVLTAPVHADLAERDLAVVAFDALAGVDPEHHPLARLAGRGFEAQRARRSAAFTEWDGNLAGQPLPSTAEQPLSASRLETWAACGFRYFLGHVLGLGERDDPERVLDLSALDRGSGVHSVLEQFLLEVLEAVVPEPDQPWTAEQRGRAQDIALEVFAHYEARGRTGRALHWRLTRTELLAVLASFLNADDAHRAATTAKPERVELPFGLDGAEPVRIDLPDGRTLSFRGRADRVDRAADGRVIVLDYKTGKGHKYRKIDEGDPVLAGTTLQLGLYAEAARQHLGAERAEAHYWMINEAERYPRHGYAWDEARRRRFIEVIAAIVEGIEGGAFAAVPGEWDSFRSTHEQCAYCAFDAVCPRDRGEMAAQRLADPRLRSRAVLLNEGAT